MFGLLLIQFIATAMALVPAGDKNYHTVRATSAADITTPKGGLYLVQATLVGGSTPGAWQYRWKGSAQATLVCPSDGTRGRRTYFLNHQIEGTLIPSGSQTFTGGITFIELVFATGPSANPNVRSLLDLQGVLIRRVDGGAVTGNITVNYDVAPGIAVAIEGYISASAGRIVFNANDNLTPQVELIVASLGRDEDIKPAPTYSATNSLTVSAISDGAATIQAALYYRTGAASA